MLKGSFEPFTTLSAISRYATLKLFYVIKQTQLSYYLRNLLKAQQHVLHVKHTPATSNQFPFITSMNCKLRLAVIIFKSVENEAVHIIIKFNWISLLERGLMMKLIVERWRKRYEKGKSAHVTIPMSRRKRVWNLICGGEGGRRMRRWFTIATEP